MDLIHERDETADIENTGVILKQKIEDRPHVSATLYHADANADYLVECSDTDSGTDADWHTLSDQDATQSFRFQGTVPERWIRIRVDTATGAADTADVGISATK